MELSMEVLTNLLQKEGFDKNQAMMFAQKLVLILSHNQTTHPLKVVEIDKFIRVLTMYREIFAVNKF